MKVIKVFISQPMNGRPFEDVMDERRAIMEEFRNFAKDSKFIDEDTTLIDVNMCFADAEEGRGRIWYLGRSIQTMENADFVIFSKGWFNAHGCRVEYEAAIQYFNCHAATNPESSSYCRCDVYTDDKPAFGKLTPMIDEVFFNRIY